MTGHDRAGGWVYLSTLCNLGWDGCHEPDCLCRCHDPETATARAALSTPPDPEETTT